MTASKSGTRFVHFVVLAATFLAGFFLHSTALGSQSHDYVRQLLTQPAAPAGDAQVPVTAATPAVGSPAATPASEGYDTGRWFFQADVDKELPAFDIATLRQYAPRNYRGPGHPAYATFFLSRNASLHDPYFISTMQVVYRLLWDQNARSNRYPVVVFVGDFVSDEQRSYFEAAGALVREVASRPFHPTQANTPVAERLKDVFSKLEMWNQTDFTRLVYLDSDAFPLLNVDMLHEAELVPQQTCNAALVDASAAPDICNFSFGAVREMTGMLNAGVMVLQPSEAMHSHLLDEYRRPEHFDHGFVEQSLLSYVFRTDGPFPATLLPETWNGPAEVRDRGDVLFILHAKIWALFRKVDHWASALWDDTWDDLLELYQNEAFVRIRAKDERRARPPPADVSRWNLDE